MTISPSQPGPLSVRAWRWMGSRDRGLSSEAIWAHMMGAPADSRDADSLHGWDHPRDPSDFGRCLRLLGALPEWRTRLSEMASLSPEWARLIARWAEIEALYDTALASKAWGSRECYDLISECIYQVAEAALGLPAVEGKP